MIKKLSLFGTVVPLPCLPSLPLPISSHPDTLIAQIKDKLFVYNDYTEGNALLSSLGIKAEAVKQCAEKSYPLDASLNCFSLCGSLFCRKKSIAPEVLSFAEKSGLTAININQGYAKCSSLVFGNNIISADAKVISKAKEKGADTLLITPENIRLDGYGCGFIGGASGCIGNTLVFFGDPSLHPDGKEIKSFAERNGYIIMCLSDETLTDYGGLIILNA